MKRLFTLTNIHTRETNRDFFNSKPEAKKERDKRNKQHDKITWVVSRGPDHGKY